MAEPMCLRWKLSGNHLMSGSSQASERGGHEMWAIARLTLLETWRRHLLILTLILTGAFLLLFWLLAHSYAANVANNVSYMSDSQLLYRRALYEVAGPGTSMLRTLSSLLGPFGVVAPPSGAFVLYAVLYLVATLGLAAWVFGRRNL